MRLDYLFSDSDIYEYIENRKKQLSNAIQSLDQNYLLNSSEEDLIAALIDQFNINIPVILDNEIHIADYGETPVDVSRDLDRYISDRSRSFYLQGTKLTIVVPFEGDAQLFKISPNVYSTTKPIGRIIGNEIHLEYMTAAEDGSAIEASYKRTVSEVKQYLDWSREFIENQFNNQLPASVREQITSRKNKIFAGSKMVASLGLPVKRRDGAPTTYAIPLSRRRPKIERPRATTAPFHPEPILALEEYEHILSIMKNMVSVMEQSPHAFEKMNEEGVRTHFLVQLNAQYEGNATGETFNFQGKTDILIRADGKNVFIGECKFWKGENVLTETIDQLLSYLSWRDTKTAILVFNRNLNFSKVLEQISPVVKSHHCYKREHPQRDETTFRFTFHQQNDPNRELLLTVMVFDVPVLSKKTKK
jgi:hypothetical protein